jgi:hypothetical protein
LVQADTYMYFILYVLKGICTGLVAGMVHTARYIQDQYGIYQFLHKIIKKKILKRRFFFFFFNCNNITAYRVLVHLFKRFEARKKKSLK